MAWSDKPTPAQLAYLTSEYESILLDELDNAKQDGDLKKRAAIKQMLDDNKVRKAVEALPTKQDVSIAIKAAQDECEVDGRVLLLLTHYFENRGVEIDYERVRKDRRKDRIKSARGGQKTKEVSKCQVQKKVAKRLL